MQSGGPGPVGPCWQHHCPAGSINHRHGQAKSASIGMTDQTALQKYGVNTVQAEQMGFTCGLGTTGIKTLAKLTANLPVNLWHAPALSLPSSSACTHHALTSERMRTLDPSALPSRLTSSLAASGEAGPASATVLLATPGVHIPTGASRDQLLPNPMSDVV